MVKMPSPKEMDTTVTTAFDVFSWNLSNHCPPSFSPSKKRMLILLLNWSRNVAENTFPFMQSISCHCTTRSSSYEYSLSLLLLSLCRGDGLKVSKEGRNESEIWCEKWRPPSSLSFEDRVFPKHMFSGRQQIIGLIMFCRKSSLQTLSTTLSNASKCGCLVQRTTISPLPLNNRSVGTSSDELGSFRKEDGSSSSSSGLEEFRVLQILPPKRVERTRFTPPRYRVNVAKEGRYQRLSPNVAWSRTWPAARVFHPAVVPLPVHMGKIKRPDIRAPPDKWNNLELMKIPNFLHLTPPAIKAHCQAIKKFCTKWPQELVTDQDCWDRFPLEYITTDHVQAGPSIRNPDARTVVLRFKLDALPLDYHAKDKIKRILNAKWERYNLDTGMVMLVSNKCPLKRQNQDYLNYLLTACFFESWKVEPWETEPGKEIQDWECFYWDKSDSKQKVIEYLKQVDSNNLSGKNDDEIESTEVVQEYKEAVTALYDEDEDPETVDFYKKSVLRLLDIESSGDKKDVKQQQIQ